MGAVVEGIDRRGQLRPIQVDRLRVRLQHGPCGARHRTVLSRRFSPPYPKSPVTHPLRARSTAVVRTARRAVGRVCAATLTPYPLGVPSVLPGEVAGRRRAT
ncbi:hypothetical protein G3I24_46165 [Micromonospora aurantiaca]|nr:hypothetical protein [Micromonospora aurantiaca]